ncbi:MAG: carboxypeptidase regulatory-like domain-containing protein [Actinomycetota bacterium]|nr:carboxypeptidase regulatory-like domain-containing protein [Actinomycetota bacterium]
MGRFIRLCVVALVLPAAIGLTGCTSRLEGKVVSASTGEPIAGAVVKVADSTSTTDGTGAFTFEGLKRQDITGTVEVEGFPPYEFSTDLQKGNQSLTLKIPDYVLTVEVKEKALEPAEIATMTVTLDGIETTSTPAAFRRVAPGVHVLTVAADGHETHEATVTLEPGESTVKVELSLTPLETYRRFLEAGKFHRNKVAYSYIHPDERKLLTLKEWTKARSGLDMKSIALGNVRMLKSWKSQLTNKTYKNVAEIDRSIEYQVTGTEYSDYGQVITNNGNQHWVKLDGLWYIVHAK